MDKAKALAIRNALSTAFSGIESRFGVKVAFRGGRFSDQNLTIKMEFAEVSSIGAVATKEVSDFSRFCHRYGLTPADHGRVFIFDGQAFTIKGAVPRSRRFPILASRTSDGKLTRFSTSLVIAGFAIIPTAQVK